MNGNTLCVRAPVRRSAVLLLLLLLLLTSFVSCTGTRADGEGAEIVCTIYPIYDWVLNVLGDLAAEHPVRLLSDSGNDPHNYQPSVRDVVEISNATLFLYVGGTSDAWAEELVEPGAHSVALLDAVDVCEGDHHHEDDAHDHSHHDHGVYDEHFWLSLANAREAVLEICRVLCAIYEDDAATVAVLRANTEAYLASLDALDARYRAAVAAAELDTVIVADRFPFAYLVRDYGLSHYAAFPGCSTDADASFATVVGLSDALKAHGITALLVTETGDREIAETVIRAASLENVEILVLHSCQTVTRSEREHGVSYLSIMEQNLSVLSRALTR